MKAEPVVSVIITNYNYARFLAACIDSVLKQTYPHVETIVVDDGSTDDSRSILQAYDGRITAILQDNAGQAAAINRGVSASRGDVICFLDSDDVWLPAKVARVVDVFREHPEVEWVRHKSQVTDQQLQPTQAFMPVFSGSGIVPPERELVLERVVNGGTTGVAIKRSLAKRVFPISIPPELAYDADDSVMFASFFAAGATGYSLDEVLALYRRHPGTRFGPHNIQQQLRREADFTAALPRVFGIREVPSAAYKLRAVCGALAGAHWWQAERRQPLLGGLAATLRLHRHPRLMARQTAALLFAFATPNLWLRKLARRAGE